MEAGQGCTRSPGTQPDPSSSPQPFVSFLLWAPPGLSTGTKSTLVVGGCPSCRDRGLGISFRGWRLSRLLKLSLGPQTHAHAAPNSCLSWQTPEHPSKPSLDDTSPEKTSWRPRGRIPPLRWLLVVGHTGSQNDRKRPRVGLEAPQRREPEHLLPF